MLKPEVHTIDLHFQGIPNTISVFLIPHARGAALVECGPGSSVPVLTQSLSAYGFTPQDITDIFVTHIHLDHAGSAGWWARQGARIHVHEVGAFHLRNPEKLLNSAGRIYGDLMEFLWGEFLPVPEDRINPLQDKDEIQIDVLNIRALDTPGHANHHMSYLLDGVCFSGDVGGIHLPGVDSVRVPSVPPEFDPEKWRYSLSIFKQEKIQAFATTHFGIHQDASWHLGALEETLDQVVAWMEKIMPTQPTREEFRNLYSRLVQEKSGKVRLSLTLEQAYETAISSQMSADGIYRYWQKNRQTDSRMDGS